MKKVIILFILLLTLIVILPANQAQALVTYNVKNGDTLWGISQKVGVPVKIIINQNKITNPKNIYVGQRLIINTNYNQITIIIDQKEKPIIQPRNYTPNSNSYIYYTVKPGDILWKIAQKYNTTVAKIISLNKIQPPYYLYIGQALILPGCGDSNINPPNQRSIYYTIKSGDILWNIAQKYNTTVKKLVKLNKIKNAYDLYVGRKLIIPVNNTNSYYNQTDLPEKEPYLPYLNRYYHVQANETLTDIAEYYQISIEDLRAINYLGNNNEIYLGQNLLMPVNPALSKKHELYQVKGRGEYIFDIAFHKGISIKSILKANYLKNPNVKFKAGTIIIIPLDQASKTNWIEYENGQPKNSLFS